MDAQSHNLLACTPCQKTFTTRKALLRHQRENKNHQYGGDERYWCLPCDRTFARNSDLLRHNREQHEDGKVPCEQCQKPIRQNAPHKSCTTTKRPHDTIEPSGFVPGSNVASSCSSRLSSVSSTQSVISEPDTASSTDISEPLSLPYRVGKPLKTSEVGSLARAVPCGLCRKTFPAKHKDKLVAHLNRHFEDLQEAPHKCDICKIAFRHKPDLEKHLATAEQGDCGFMFHHKRKCTGHQPPSDFRRGSKRRRAGLDDDDRFDFCFRIRNWEHAQDVAFSNCIGQLRADIGPQRGAASFSCGNVVARSGRYLRPSAPARLVGGRPARSKALKVVDKDGESHSLYLATNFPDTQTHPIGIEILRVSTGGDSALIEAFLALEANVNFADDLGRTALHYGVDSGSTSALNLLTAHGANIDAIDIFGMSPLSHACVFGKSSVVQWLVSQGAEVVKRDLEVAIRSDDVDMLSILAEEWAERPRQSMSLSGDYKSLADYCVRMQSPYCLGWLYSQGTPGTSHSEIAASLSRHQTEGDFRAILCAELGLSPADLHRLIMKHLCWKLEENYFEADAVCQALLDLEMVASDKKLNAMARDLRGLCEKDPAGVDVVSQILIYLFWDRPGH